MTGQPWAEGSFPCALAVAVGWLRFPQECLLPQLSLSVRPAHSEGGYLGAQCEGRAASPQPSLPPLCFSLRSVAKPVLLACCKQALKGELEPWGSWVRPLTAAPAPGQMLGAALWMVWG